MKNTTQTRSGPRRPPLAPALVVVAVSLLSAINGSPVVRAQDTQTRATLTLIRVSVDKEAKGESVVGEWSVDPNGKAATVVFKGVRTNFEITMPEVIRPSGTPARFRIVLAPENGRHAPGVQVHGEVDFSNATNNGQPLGENEGQPNGFQVLAERGETKDVTRQFTITPRKYSEGRKESVILKLGFSFGPNISYEYRIDSTAAHGLPSAPEGLYLQAGEATVRRGQKVSIPIYLRYNGAGAPPSVANINFTLNYESPVAKVRAHPSPATKPVETKETLEPELPRGNLLPPGQALIAGNTKDEGIVRAGFAARSGIKPGTGKPGETVTEIYFEAVGRPGDKTPLTLAVSTVNDAEGNAIPIQTIPGLIRIPEDRPPPIQTPGTQTPGTQTPGTQTPGTQTPLPPPPGDEWRALDAYFALLMSIERRTQEPDYDVDRDGKVTSSDSRKILQEATKVRSK